ncbi:MAG: hypothetical protein ACRDNF_03385, partial [Streptosporangiaceae bacterium]
MSPSGRHRASRRSATKRRFAHGPAPPAAPKAGKMFSRAGTPGRTTPAKPAPIKPAVREKISARRRASA